METESLQNFYVIGDDGISRDIAGVVTDISVNHTLDGATQVSVRLTDPERRMLRANYFAMNREYEWEGDKYLLTSIQVSNGEGEDANISLELNTKVFQLLKTDYKPAVYRSANGFQFAEKIAKKYNLGFVGEPVKGKQQTIKVKSKNNKESTWNVLSRAASDNQYMCFIANKTLYFASPKYLLGQWGIDSVEIAGKASQYATYPTTPVPTVKGSISLNNNPVVTYDGEKVTDTPVVVFDERLYVIVPIVDGEILISKSAAFNRYKETGRHLGKFRTKVLAESYLKSLVGIQKQYAATVEKTKKVIQYIPLVYPTPSNENRFLLMAMPQMRKSVDSIKQAEGSATMWGENARQLRAGMTAMIYGMGDAFDQAYLITSVDYQMYVPEPVKINFATVSKLAPEEKAKVDKKVSETTVISGTGGND